MTGSSSMGPLRVSLVGLTTTHQHQHQQQQPSQQQQQPQQQQELQQTSTTTTTTTTAESTVVLVNQRERQRVSRNLFGSIASGESQRLLDAENERVRQKFRNNYNFDIATGELLSRSAVEQQPPLNVTTTLVGPADELAGHGGGHSMNLLEREQAMHLESLKYDNYVNDLLITPPQVYATAARRVVQTPMRNLKQKQPPSSGSDVLTPTAHVVTPSLLGSDARHKPYARQLKLTESYNQRKSLKCQRNGAMPNVSAGRLEEDQSTVQVLTGCVKACQQQQQQDVKEEEEAEAEVVEDNNNKDLPTMTRVPFAVDEDDDDAAAAAAANHDDDHHDDDDKQANTQNSQQQQVEVAITATTTTTHKTLETSSPATSSSAPASSSHHLCAQRRQAQATLT